MSASAVAESLDIPVGTAQSRLNRALAELRAAIAADERQPAEAWTATA
jgi:DNA-directed RNA polymerase specialized sigma24 family protein